MTISLKNVFLFILAIVIFAISWHYFSLIAGVVSLISYSFVLAFVAIHRKNKRNWQRHTDRRSGEIYDVEQNKKRGKKNKKYKKTKNSNKKPNE